MGPNMVQLVTDGHEHATDQNANFIVSYLNFRNRTTNTGILYVGGQGTTDYGGIQLLAGQSVSIPWCYPSQAYYKILGSVSTDVFECWWGG
jgi:hypothetical protein